MFIGVAERLHSYRPRGNNPIKKYKKHFYLPLFFTGQRLESEKIKINKRRSKKPHVQRKNLTTN
jgi:hypothetical protein